MLDKTPFAGRAAAPCAAPAVTNGTSRARLAAAWRCFHAGMRSAGYTITIVDPLDKNRTFNLSDASGLPDPIPADQVLDRILHHAWSALARGCSPVARPRPAGRTIFQIDDLGSDRLDALLRGGWRPCYTQETSPGSFQAAIASGPLPEDVAAAVRRRLVILLGGDPGANGAYRLPGFQNGKPIRRQPDGSFPRVRALSWPGEICPRTCDFAALVAADLSSEPCSAPPSPATDAPLPLPMPPLDARITRIWQRVRHHAVRAKGPEWKSQHDWLMALILRYAGASVEEVSVALEVLTPRHKGRGKGNEGAYATAASITASRAFGPPGDAALRNLAGFHRQWDRDLAAEVGS